MPEPLIPWADHANRMNSSASACSSKLVTNPEKGTAKPEVVSCKLDILKTTYACSTTGAITTMLAHILSLEGKDTPVSKKMDVLRKWTCCTVFYRD